MRVAPPDVRRPRVEASKRMNRFRRGSLFFRFSRRIITAWAVVVATLLGGSRLAAQQAPLGDENAIPLPSVRPFPENQKLWKAASEKLAASTAAVQQFEAKVADGKIATLSVKTLSQAVVELDQLSRIGADLSLIGEPAGYDLRQRCTRLQARLTKVLVGYQNLPKTQRVLRAATGAIGATSLRATANLTRAKDFMKRGQYERAQQELHNAIDALRAVLVWYNDDVQTSTLKPFTNYLRDTVRPKVTARVRKRQHDLLTGLRQEKAPNFAKLLEQLATAATALQTQTRASLDGESLTGPELAERAMQLWSRGHNAVLSCRGIDSLRKALGDPDAAAELHELAGQYANFCKKLPELIAQLIGADANRADAAAAETLYKAYLERLAAWESRTAIELENELQPALQEFQKKSPQLAAQVAWRRAASSDAVRWHKRFEQASAERHSAGQVAIPELALRVAQSSQSQEGIVPPEAKSLGQATLPKNAPAFARRLASQAGAEVGMVGPAEPWPGGVWLSRRRAWWWCSRELRKTIQQPKGRQPPFCPATPRRRLRGTPWQSSPMLAAGASRGPAAKLNRSRS